MEPVNAARPTRLSPSTEPWQDVLRDPRSSISPAGWSGRRKACALPVSAWPKLDKRIGSQWDGAVRALATFGGVRPELRARWNDTGYYKLYAGAGDNTGKLVLGRHDNPAQWTTVHEFPLREPLQPGQDYESNCASSARLSP